MFQRPIPPAQAAPSLAPLSQTSADPIEGYVYCAAQNVQRLAHLAATAEDADRLLCSLANLECIARATGSPEHDIRELEAWRTEAERRVASLRVARASVQIATEIIEKRRVPA